VQPAATPQRMHCITTAQGACAVCARATRPRGCEVVHWLEICVGGLSFTAKESLMQMLYNSDSFAVVMFDVSDESAGASVGGLNRGGYEIVDKFARKEIFIEGALAQSFKEGVEALIESEPSEEEIDEYLGRFSSLMQHPVILH
jgi:hypothetical protein